MSNEIEKAEKILKEYNQEKVLKILENASNENKEKLAKSILNVDLQYATDVFENVNKKIEIQSKSIQPLSATVLENTSETEKDKYKKLGEDIIKNNQYAVVTLAGGQGTRLGHSGPKGTYKINTIKGEKYLFEIFCETMQKANKQYNVVIPWYIMTSEENDADTKQFFKEHNYFGYNTEKVKFFKQSKMPLMSPNGDLLVDENYQIKQAADGHGGVFRSLKNGKIIENLEKNNIKWVFTCAVDNVLVNMVDPYLIGVAISKNCKLATKTLIKNSPKEKIGVMCKQNNKVKVIEYTEISEEMANQKDKNGELVYGEAHVMFNLFSIDAIKSLSEQKLPYHKAFKKYNYLNENGNLIQATEPNSYKFESFIFDAFEKFDNIAMLRGKRENNCAPIKNATGIDSPETAINLYNQYWKNNF